MKKRNNKTESKLYLNGSLILILPPATGEWRYRVNFNRLKNAILLGKLMALPIFIKVVINCPINLQLLFK